ncbi:hypothetical protein IC757_08160 [Wenzhouxiangella sp. AB-CW3]|uniref:hypothetical protein n=1 Tax=Wenzhouxiangella sp. AB-CW3 TaxID=2771012 RepID=UPI00168B45AE|nr:hypothetical protein [Wenzhouxiangella sp. AB-CW3]QOC24063.1 hypothetical protein IC757_08160 [Wenzhouxiangella sp. AB-CW3]
MKQLLIALLFPVTASATGLQELLVSEHAYYLDGTEQQELNALDSDFDPNRPFIILACACIDTSRLIEVMDWLTEKGDVQLVVKTVPHKEHKLCGEC